MSAGTYDILLEENTTFALKVRLQDSLGQPIDLSQMVFKSSIKSVYDEAAPTIREFTVSVLDSDVTLTTDVGVLAPDEGSEIPPWDYSGVPKKNEPGEPFHIGYWDLVSEHTVTKTKTRWLQGKVSYSDGVTKIGV